MRLSRHHRWQWAILWLCVLLVLPLGTPTVAAGERDDIGTICPVAMFDLNADARSLTASWWQVTFGSRTRVIQLTTLAVILGIFILQWRRT